MVAGMHSIFFPLLMTLRDSRRDFPLLLSYPIPRHFFLQFSFSLMISLLRKTLSDLCRLSHRPPFFLVVGGIVGLWFTFGAVVSQAQDQPPKRVITPQLADGAQDVSTADLDGDGDEDVLSASATDNKIAWYENTGGSFSPQKTITTDANLAESVYATDIDGDGDQDVLSASNGDDKIAWYENTGGSFSSQKIITTNTDGANSVYAADLDGDDDADVLSASWRDDKIAWYENTGGSFSSQKIITTDADGAGSVYAADLDGDGDQDVLSASSGGDKIAWYENTGGSFSSQKVITTNVNTPHSVYATDLDGDGDTDVLSASFSDDKIAWYENTGGSFSSQKIITTDADGAGSVYAADLDGDGDPDVLSASASGNKVSAYDNQINEEGGFGGELTVSESAERPRSVHATDLDGDSEPDVLSASALDDKIAWYENQLSGSGGFGSQQVIVPFGSVEDALSVHSADLDGDGDNDVLSASRNDDKIAWYENTGVVSFSGQKVITTNADGPESVYAADLDGDGDQDVLSASISDNKVAWYENTGGSFSSQKVITTNANTAQSVYAADLDGDGDHDVLSASGGGSDGKIAWYENTGGSFSGENTITTNVEQGESVYAADLTGDGALDVLSASFGDDKIAWYENTGGGSFSEQKVISTDASGAQSVYATDLDEDGDVDVLAASEGGFDSSSKITWYENSTSFGSISFSSRTITTNVQAAQDVFASDLNGDGIPDVLSASALDDKVAWYENSSGSFSDQKVINATTDGPASIHASDLDGDDDKDVLAAAFDGNEITWYQNINGVLPVELAGFDATVDGDKVAVSWKTASETNNAGFRIQRRVGEVGNGSETAWTTVGKVEGSGTTSQSQYYRFTDTNLPYEADHLTYRLKQIDTDGTVHYSKTVHVERGTKTLQLLGLAPNPATEQMRIRYSVPEGQEGTIQLYDILGRAVRQVAVGLNGGRYEEKLDVSGLAAGVYFVRLSAGEQTKTRKVVVQ